MKFDKERVGETLIVRLDGELDLHTAVAFRAEVEGAFHASERLKNLILVLEDVPFVDSSGLGAILGRYKQLQVRGGKLVAVKVQPQVRRIFELAGMLKLIEVTNSEHRALRKI